MHGRQKHGRIDVVDSLSFQGPYEINGLKQREPNLHILTSCHSISTRIMKAILSCSAILAFSLVVHAIPTPTGVPSASTAKTELKALIVAAQGPQTGYSQDEFPHWISQSNSCDTREVVLKRDGTNVVQSSTCAATSGTWVSPYDGAKWKDEGDLDIDHLVPLSNAWKVHPFCRL